MTGGIMKIRLWIRWSVKLWAISSLLCLTACSSTAPKANYRSLAQAAVRLQMDIDRKDNHRLYVEASKWIGVPYRAGGSTRSGTDCSGLSSQLYQRVYRIRLPHSSQAQKQQAKHSIQKRNLREGDLVFFGNGRSRKRITHVGVYLKDGKFIHASNRGVIISSLHEPYYKKCWIEGGRY